MNQQDHDYNYPSNVDTTWKEARITSSSEDIYQHQQEEEKEVIGIEESMRMGFIRKVYSILACQLLLTVLLCYISLSFPSFSKFQKEHFWLTQVAMVLSLIIILVLVCIRNVAKSVPSNYILLSIFTILEAYLVSFICSLYETNIILLAGAMTIGLVIGLTVYSYFTKTDFTNLGGILFIILLAMIMFGLACCFTNNKILINLYCGLGVIVFGIYLIFDTQLIIGDKSKSISIDEYVFASLSLYLNIINIFIHILRLLGNNK